MDAQTFEDFKSKYLDIHDKYKRDQGVEKVSIINDVDFENNGINAQRRFAIYVDCQVATLPTEQKKSPNSTYKF